MDLKREDESSVSFTSHIPLDPEFPVFHGVIDCKTATDRLGTVARPGAFLVRNTGWRWTHVITYFDQKLDLRHTIINISANTELRKHNPHITNLQTAVEVMVSLEPKRFVHEVHWQTFNNIPKQRCKSEFKNVCHVCEKEYSSPSERCHMNVHKVTYCESCLGLIPQSQISDHKITCEQRPKDIKCHFCNFQTRYRRSIKDHIETMHGKQSIQCQYCQKYFSSSEFLESHLKLHLGYNCSVCGKQFKTNHGRKRHEDANHVENDKEFKTFLKIDNDNSSPKQPCSLKGKGLQCKFCDYQTDSKKLFRRHVERLHLSDRTPVLYNCEFCPYSSKYKKSILFHQKNACPSREFNVVWFDD